ncbi:hypothetical protein CCYA_CCYA03G1117 [Cyanidiococcus yangmingshanensis]|nr:hypothetical protein CCYA_CCYA03G1117 [Cyanidiococcus yangmingshanensis]
METRAVVDGKEAGQTTSLGARRAPEARHASASVSTGDSTYALPEAPKRMSPMATRRLHKELSDWYLSGRTAEHSPQPTILLETPVTRLDEWFVSLRGADSTLYAGEWYRLRFRFPSDYPIEAPEVVFLGTPPVHEHVYSNGHLCLSILYDSWSPALTVNSVALSIQSMLSSATEKRRPPDNDTYVRNCRGRSPKHTRWLFHDDGV